MNEISCAWCGLGTHAQDTWCGPQCYESWIEAHMMDLPDGAKIVMVPEGEDMRMHSMEEETWYGV